MPFTILTREDDGEFAIQAPDGATISEWAEEDEMAVLEWDGTVFFATRSSDWSGMVPDKVYELGSSKKTEVKADEGEDEREDEDDDEEEDDDADAAGDDDA